MNCRKCQRELSAYLDGEVTGARRAEIEAHVAGCADCRQRLAELRQIATGVAALPRLHPARQFVAAVRRKLRAAERRPWFDTLFKPVWLKVPLEAVAAAVVVAGVLLWVSRPPPPEQQAARDGEHGNRLEHAKRAVAAAAPAAAPAAEQVPVETITVVDADAAFVQQQAAQVAVGLAGRVLPAAPTAQKFQVELPRRNVLAFKSQLAQVNTRQQQVKMLRGRAAPTGALAEAALMVATEKRAADELQEADAPPAVVEIQVVPPR